MRCDLVLPDGFRNNNNMQSIFYFKMCTMNGNLRIIMFLKTNVLYKNNS